MKNNQSGLNNDGIPKESSIVTESTDKSSESPVESSIPPESHKTIQEEPFEASTECPAEQTPIGPHMSTQAVPSTDKPSQPYIVVVSGKQSNVHGMKTTLVVAKGKPGSGLKQHKNSNFFSVLAEKNNDNKENPPFKRIRKPAQKILEALQVEVEKVAEALQIEIEAMSKKKKG